MELRDLIRMLGRSKYFVILSATFFGVVAFAVSYNLKATYLASMVMYVKGQTVTRSQDYFTYEGFYSQQTAKEFTDTVVGLSKSKDITKKALQTLDRPDDIEDIKEIQDSLSVRKTAPQLIQLTINNSNAQEATKLVEALVRAVSERVNELNNESGILVIVAPIDNTPLVEEKKPLVVLNTFVAALAGLVLSLTVISIKEYLKEPSL